MIKPVTDRYLMMLWSLAVMAINGDRCLECNDPASGAHHIFHRHHNITRYVVLNGIPLCTYHHHRADYDQTFALSFLEPDDRDYLVRLGTTDFKTWLWANNLTKYEWMQKCLRDLKETIEKSRSKI